MEIKNRVKDASFCRELMLLKDKFIMILIKLIGLISQHIYLDHTQIL